MITIILKECLNCGEPLQTLHGNRSHLFCSMKCGRQWHKKVKAGKAEWPEIEPYEFKCRQCGRTVTISDIRDKRTVFCSQRCEKNYWGNPRKTEPVKIHYAKVI